MEPKTPSPEFAREQQPTPIEYSFPTERPEMRPEQTAERAPEANQELHRATTTASTAAPVALPTPVPAPAADDPATTQGVVAPTTAADEDLIEKEWVDKAKKIISETKDDPHAREQLVSKLQIEYLRKRYGKELGAAE